MDSTVISIPNSDSDSTSPNSKQNTKQFSFSSIVSRLRGEKCNQSVRNVIHAIKVGIALFLVSLLYLLDPLFEQVGENAMWAIMTVVVVFEFYAGATLSKGINRAIGTILGGGLGCLAAILGDKAGRTGNAVVVGTSVFVIGAAATYTRLMPRMKRRYDYGVMIFLLTFNLIVVSGLRAEAVIHLARERLATIGMGFVVCIFTSLLIFPMWASDELHCSTASKFENLASCIEECLEEYLRIHNKEENQPSSILSQGCKSVLHSKSKDELLANFAKWEPWHGKFGFSHPWKKYIEIGEVLRELAAIVISLQVCTQSPRQPAPTQRTLIKEPCEMIGLSLAEILREVGETILKMKRCQAKALIVPKLQSVKLEISQLNSLTQTAEGLEPDEHCATASFLFLLTEIAAKAQVLAEEVEHFGELACFQLKKPSVVHNL